MQNAVNENQANISHTVMKIIDFDRLQQLWPMPSNLLPIVIVGAGGIVRDAHLPAYKKWGFQVAGIFDRDPARAKALAGDFDVPEVYSSLDEALNACESAVLDIALPPQALREVLPRIPRGRAALIQKPFGTDLEDAKQLAKVLENNQVTVATNFQLRFTPSMQAITDSIKQGIFGKIVEIDVHLVCRTPWEMWPFMRELDAVEIPLHSIHYLDWIRATLGQPKKVYAKSVRHPDYPELADARSSIILDYADNVRCCLSLNHTHKWGPKQERATFRIEGTKGAAKIGLGYNVNFPEGKLETLHMISGESDWIDVKLRGARVPDSFAGVMANLQRFVAGEDKELPTSIAQSVATMALVEACLKSNATGEAVSVRNETN